MKCPKAECFAYNPSFENNCSALHITEWDCRFYKTKEELRIQRERLMRMGKPYYKASTTPSEAKLLEVLLHERPNNLDKT